MNISQRGGVNGKASEKVGEAKIRFGNSGDGDSEGIIL